MQHDEGVADGWGETGVGCAGEVAELFGGVGAGLVDAGEDEFGGEGEEEGGDDGEVLVAHCSEDDPDAAVMVEFADVVGEGLCSGGVMGSVEEDVGGGRDVFETAGPAGLGDALADGVVRDVEKVEGGDGGEGVFDLVGSDEGTFDGDGGGALGGETAAVGVEVEVLGDPVGGAEDGRGVLSGGAFEDGLGFGPLAGEDDGAGRFDDAGLFEGDFGDGVAEEAFVVEVDGGDDGEDGIDDVGGVETAAHAGFEDHGVDGLGAEEQVGHGGDGLEIAGVHVDETTRDELFGGFMDFVEGGGEVGDRDGKARDADAFGGFDEVGGGIDAGADAGDAKGGFDHGADGAFAVGAGDVDGAKGAVGEGEGGEEGLDAFEAEFDGFELVA